MTDEAAVAMEGVTFGYSGRPQFRFDLSVVRGETVALMGASGSGKSTLLHLLAGFETPQAGRIRIAGRDMAGVAPAARPLTMVFQENNLFGHLSVADNAGLGLSPSLRLAGADRAAVSEALAKVGLAGKEDRLPAELSGGERQRVALARALLRDRPVLLLDEPFASLGPALRNEMLDLVAGIAEAKAMTVLMVTHNPDDAGRIADRIAFLDHGEVAATGSASAFLAGEAPEAFRAYAGK